MITKTKSYGEKLKDPRWQRKRLEILERNKFICCVCGATDKTLHVHHGVYRKGFEPWEADDDTLWTLCEECHESVADYMADIYLEIGRLDPNIIQGSVIYAITDCRQYESYDPLSVMLEYYSIHGISEAEKQEIIQRLNACPIPENAPARKKGS